MKAVLYSRVSTERQASEGVSLEAQLDKTRTYAAYHGLEIIGEFCDAGISGKSMSNRPEFIKALNLACEEKAVLVFYSLSRISRSTRDLMEIAERVKKAEAGLASLQEQIDTTTAMGCFLFTILSALSALERELIGERTRGALQFLKAEGRVYCGKTPYGYVATEDGRLVKEPEEQRVLAIVLEWKNKEWLNYKEIAARLNKQGIPAKNGGIWHGSPLRRILLDYKKQQETK